MDTISPQLLPGEFELVLYRGMTITGFELELFDVDGVAIDLTDATYNWYARLSIRESELATSELFAFEPAMFTVADNPALITLDADASDLEDLPLGSFYWDLHIYKAATSGGTQLERHVLVHGPVQCKEVLSRTYA